MSYSGLSDLFEYLCYGSTAIRNTFHSYSTGIDFSRQNLTSTDVTFCRTFKVRPHRTPRRALKKLSTVLYFIAGAVLHASCAALRCAAPRNESWKKFIFHGAAFFRVAL